MTEEYDAFKSEVRATAKARGVASLKEWEEKYPGEHLWATWGNGVVCALCSLFKRRDGKNKPCKGLSEISLR